MSEQNQLGDSQLKNQSLRKRFELLYNTGIEDEIITQACLRDAGTLTLQSPESFFKDNQSFYKFSINTWFMLLVYGDQVCAYDSGSMHIQFITALYDYGFIPLIKEAVDLANTIIADHCIIRRDIDSYNIKFSIFSACLQLWEKQSITVQDQLQRLRFLKRFSPVNTDKLESDALFDFVKNENCLRELTRNSTLSESYLVRWCVKKTKEILHDWLRNFSIDTVNSPEYLLTQGYFSNGSVFEAHNFSERVLTTTAGGKAYKPYPKAQATKVALYYNTCELTESTLAASSDGSLIPLQQGIYDRDLDYYSRGLLKYDTLTRLTRFSSVDKSYKQRRTIAIEEAARIPYMQAVRSCIRSTILAHSEASLVVNFLQDPNQEGACKGSRYRSIATIDCSSASDLMSAELVRSVFPPDVLEACEKYKSTHLLLPNFQRKDGRPIIRLMHKYCAMGSPLCFDLESLLFAAIDIAAAYLAAHLTGHSPSDVKKAIKRGSFRAYGDDQEVPTWAAETTMWLLTKLGFVINKEKSHYDKDDPYRESCGKEYLNSIEISSKYYPRHDIFSDDQAAISDKDKYCMVLVDLQHKFFNYPVINSYLICEILTLKPSMTYSEPNSTYSDIWTVEASDYTRKREAATANPESFYQLLKELESENSDNVLLQFYKGRAFNKSQVKRIIRFLEEYHRLPEVHMTDTWIYPVSHDHNEGHYLALASIIIYKQFLRTGSSYSGLAYYTKNPEPLSTPASLVIKPVYKQRIDFL